MMFIYFSIIIILTSTPAKPQNYERIDHSKNFFNGINDLYLNENTADVILLVENERLPAHRVVLALHSEFFRAMLYGGLGETRKQEVELLGTSVTPFKVLLSYAYTGRMDLRNLQGEVILELYILSNQYSYLNLILPLSEYLRENINIYNVCTLYNEVRLYNQKEFLEDLFKFFDKHASEVLKSDDILSLSSESLHEIINRDSFSLPELDILNAVFRWVQANDQSKNADDETRVFSGVRHSLISFEETLKIIKDSQLNVPHIIDAIKVRNLLPSRKVHFPRKGSTQVNEGTSDTE